jgi:cellulose synthase/poly-beta-1,6-N-acetylglucosamine synthase-like glycosyltransferase
VQIVAVIFFVAVGLQTIYFLFFLVGLSRWKQSGGVSARWPVSVIVCAHDEEENLRELIPLLLDQDYPDYEIIIVEERSNDNTFDLLLEETKKHPRLRMVRVETTPENFNPKKYGLTLGIKAATYEHLVFTDADCRPATREWLAKMASGFDEQVKIVLGYSPYFKKRGWLNRFIRFETLVTAIQYLSYALSGIPYMGVGRNLAYCKSLFINNKGFHGILHLTGGDDDLFVNRHATAGNTRVCLGHESVVYSEAESTWAQFFRQKVRHLSAGKQYKAGHRLMLGFFVLSHFIAWFTGLLLLFTYQPYYWIAAALVLRILMLMTVVWMAGKKFGDKFELWPVAFLDFLYSIYYISTGLRALTTKKVKWRS